MKITFLGHAAFRIDFKDKVILIDPFITGNPLASKDLVFDSVDYIFVTHGHKDHLGDTVRLSEEFGAKVFGVPELVNILSSKFGVKNTFSFNKGGTINVDDVFSVTMVKAEHTCSIQIGDERIYAGETVGFVFHLGKDRVYHAGDTSVFSDMSLIKELYAPNICLLPVGNHYTMGELEFVKAVELLGGDVFIPMHFKTFPVLTQNLDKLKKRLSFEDWKKVKILSSGETFF